jgi:hypothetical protein
MGTQRIRKPGHAGHTHRLIIEWTAQLGGTNQNRPAHQASSGRPWPAGPHGPGPVPAPPSITATSHRPKGAACPPCHAAAAPPTPVV